MRRILWAAAFIALAAGGTQADAQRAESADLELVLLADASGSIDNAEIRFQRQGYATAITHPEVLGAIAQGYDQRIAVTYVEWGMTGSQDVVVPWTIVDGPDSAAAFADALMAAPRRAFGRNAIGEALAFGQALIESNEVESYRKVIDLSADSANSWSGLSIAEARERLVRRHRHQRPRDPLPPLLRPAGPLRPRGSLRRAHHRRPGQLRHQCYRRRAFCRCGAQEAGPGDRRHARPGPAARARLTFSPRSDAA
jgi:hypothetical protein